MIISQIHSSHTVYHLGTAEIIDLKNSGVRDRVIDFMINTRSSAVAQEPVAAVVQEPVAPAPVVESVVVAPGPDYIWVAGEWTWYWGHWVWCGGHWAVPPYREARWFRGGWSDYHGHRAWLPGHWR